MAAKKKKKKRGKKKRKTTLLDVKAALVERINLALKGRPDARAALRAAFGKQGA